MSLPAIGRLSKHQGQEPTLLELMSAMHVQGAYGLSRTEGAAYPL